MSEFTAAFKGQNNTSVYKQYHANTADDAVMAAKKEFPDLELKWLNEGFDIDYRLKCYEDYGTIFKNSADFEYFSAKKKDAEDRGAIFINTVDDLKNVFASL